MSEKLHATPEKQPAEISEIITFNDTEVGGGSSGLLFDSRGGDVFAWGDAQWSDRPDSRRANTTIIATESGNQYIVGKGIICNMETMKARFIPRGFEMPDIEFGQSWGVPNVFQTSPVQSILVEYKVGGVQGRRYDGDSPFTNANRILEEKIRILNDEHGEY